jgi:hypothetical protein
LISFNFCFELPASGEVSIFSRNNENSDVPIQFYVEDGNISVSPWPFSVENYQGYIIGYKQDGYPSLLDPVIIPFYLSKQN